MKANTPMVVRWRRVQGGASRTVLTKMLAELATSPLVDVGGAVVLEALQGQSGQPPAPDDLTGYEAATNKIHVADYVEGCSDDALLRQGVAFAECLAFRLRSLEKPCRVILSLDPDSAEVTVRFFVRRERQPWGAEDVEDYRMEEVMQWDVG